MNHHKKRDEETEFLMPGLMMKKMHAKESPQRSSKGSPCEECNFPDAPSAMDGFPLVDAVENACDGIEGMRKRARMVILDMMTPSE